MPHKDCDIHRIVLVHQGIIEIMVRQEIYASNQLFVGAGVHPWSGCLTWTTTHWYSWLGCEWWWYCTNTTLQVRSTGTLPIQTKQHRKGNIHIPGRRDRKPKAGRLSPKTLAGLAQEGSTYKTRSLVFLRARLHGGMQLLWFCARRVCFWCYCRLTMVPSCPIEKEQTE